MSFRISMEDLDNRDGLAEKQNSVNQSGPGKPLRTTRSKEREIDPSINPLKPNILDTARVMMGATSQVSTEDLAKAQFSIAAQKALRIPEQGDIDSPIDEEGNYIGGGQVDIPNASAGGANISFSNAGNAATRGWGPAPAPRSKMVAVRVGANNVEFPGGVHSVIVPLVVTLVARIEAATGELAKDGWCWGYADRRIRGGTSWSNHAWGLAIDFNAPNHPLGVENTFGTHGAEVSRIAADLGFRWGGDYNNRKDDMHFEFMGRPEDVDEILNEDIVEQFKITGGGALE